MTTQAPLQAHLDEAQRSVARRSLPGMQPVGGEDWITVDDAYTAQLAEKARLLETVPDAVLQVRAEAAIPMDELLDEVLTLLARRSDFQFSEDQVIRPDGRSINIDRKYPLKTLSQLVQEDFCILQKIGEEHWLTAALLCFPASWTLAEKIGKPLTVIHTPVDSYDENIAKRVQRLFDAVRVGHPMWRANLLTYKDPALFQPRLEADPRNDDHIAHFERSERQTILRLPKTKAVVFAIHTTVTPL